MGRIYTASDDPASAPHPEGGWSHGVTEVPQATVNRLNLGYLVHPSGVFDSDGNFVAQAVHWRGRALMTPPPFPVHAAPLPGRWLWGGLVMDHFGHFLMESLGRLWALDRAQVQGIVFLHEAGFGPDVPQLKPWQSRLMQLLGIDLPVRVLTEPTRIQHLTVPGQGFGIGPLISGHAPFRAFVQSRFAKDIAPEGPERLYISRSRMAANLGGIVREATLERHMAKAGYEIFHPQDHGLEVQIARYKAARQVVGLDGSSFHLFALVARPDQEVAVIKRRPGSAPEGIVDHIRGFTGRTPLVIDAIKRNWVRSDRKKADNMSYGEVDFRKLGLALEEAGFLPAGSGLKGLADHKVVEFMAQVQAQMGRRGPTFTPLAPNGRPFPPQA